MSDFDLDMSQLEKWQKTLQQITRDFPQESKKMLRNVGNEAKKIISRNAKKLVRKDEGDYHRSIKRGKIWNEDGVLIVRVYSRDRKKFWIEHGHRIVDKNGVERGFVQGKKVFERSENEIQQKFVQIVTEQMNKIFKAL